MQCFGVALFLSLASACMQVASEEKNTQWKGWPLPWCNDTDNMPDISIYGRDCIQYVKMLMKVSGMVRAEPRTLPGMAQASNLRSREDRRGFPQQG